MKVKGDFFIRKIKEEDKELEPKVVKKKANSNDTQMDKEILAKVGYAIG